MCGHWSVVVSIRSQVLVIESQIEMSKSSAPKAPNIFLPDDQHSVVESESL